MRWVCDLMTWNLQTRIEKSYSYSNLKSPIVLHITATIWLKWFVNSHWSANTLFRDVLVACVFEVSVNSLFSFLLKEQAFRLHYKESWRWQAAWVVLSSRLSVRLSRWLSFFLSVCLSVRLLSICLSVMFDYGPPGRTLDQKVGWILLNSALGK